MLSNQIHGDWFNSEHKVLRLKTDSWKQKLNVNLKEMKSEKCFLKMNSSFTPFDFINATF